MNRTAVIYFEDAIFKLVSEDPDFVFDSAYFESPRLHARPNSTLRLNLVNFLALRELAKRYPIDLLHYDQVKGSVADLMRYEQIVVNTVASKRTVSFVTNLLRALASSEDPPKVVFGTEFSWTNNVTSGNVSQEIVDSVYLDHLVLRHTARTDRHLYEDQKYRGARVQEFEIGIDLESMPEPVGIAERQDILFVSAPAGRVTKNNDEIWAVKEELDRRGISKKFPVRIIEPPYTTSDYWQALRSARFIIFTSLGETFSYVLNDALAMGVVGLRRPELFSTRTSRFGVDSYWDVGLRYSSPADAADTIAGLNTDTDRLEAESVRSMAITQRRFGVPAVKANWLKLLSGASLNGEGMYVVDLESLSGGLEEAFRIARDLDCKYVLAFMSRGLAEGQVSSYSVPTSDRTQVALPYCYKEASSRIRAVGPNLSSSRIVDEPSKNDVLDYLRIVVRTNKIARVIVDQSVNDHHLNQALEELEYLEGERMVPVEAEIFSRAASTK